MARGERLQDMKNIGPAMLGWLNQAGITTPTQLRQIGAVEAYLAIRPLEPRVINRMALYALYGAINGENCIFLSSDIKGILNALLAEAQQKE